jgi:hypothetical protein
VESEALLQTHAEISIALAGFASVVAALRHPLTAFARQRFLSLLGLSLVLVLGCLLPLWCVPLFESSSTAWRILSAILLGLNAARMWWLILLPIRALDGGTQIMRNPLANKIFWGVPPVTFLLLGLNVVGLPFAPSFDVYYVALLAGLVSGFALFANVVVADT